MSFSQQNKRLNEDPEYRYAFLTIMFMHYITLIIALIARLFLSSVSWPSIEASFIPIFLLNYSGVPSLEKL